MKVKAKGKTDSEIFFLSKINDGTLSVDIDGNVFNNKTGNYIGATGSGRYPKISMKNLETNKICNIQIHRLVWLTFKGDIPDDLIINHKDLNKENRALDNLELTTYKGNSIHFSKSDKFRPLPGEKNGNSKLLDSEVKWMKEDRKLNKRSYKYYADIFDVHKATIKTAISGERYYTVD